MACQRMFFDLWFPLRVIVGIDVEIAVSADFERADDKVTLLREADIVQNFV